MYDKRDNMMKMVNYLHTISYKNEIYLYIMYKNFTEASW